MMLTHFYRAFLILGLVFVLAIATDRALANEPVPASHIEALIKQLGASSFNERERASFALADLGDTAFDALERHENHPDPEIRARIKGLLTRLTGSLPRLDPKQEKLLTSDGSGVRVKLTFENRSKETIRIFWKNFDGERQAWRKPLKHGGQDVCESTFESHVWIVTDEKERALGVYVIGKTDARIVVRPRKRSAGKN